MKWLKFDDVQHQAYKARYEIDWDTNDERQYKQPINGVRVYENGQILLTEAGYRQPHWRSQVFKLLGLDIITRSEFTGLKFFHPRTGKRVPTTAIQGHSFLKFKDRLYSLKDGVQQAMVFIHENAQPLPRNKVNLQTRNLKREKLKMKQLAPFLDLGETLLAVGKPEYLYFGYYQHAFVINPPPATVLTDENVQETCKILAKDKGSTRNAVRIACSDRDDVDYLLIGE